MRVIYYIDKIHNTDACPREWEFEKLFAIADSFLWRCSSAGSAGVSMTDYRSSRLRIKGWVWHRVLSSSPHQDEPLSVQCRRYYYCNTRFPPRSGANERMNGSAIFHSWIIDGTLRIKIVSKLCIHLPGLYSRRSIDETKMVTWYTQLLFHKFNIFVSTVQHFYSTS